MMLLVSIRLQLTSREPSESYCSLNTGMMYPSVYHVISYEPSEYVEVYPYHSTSSPMTVLVSKTSGSPATSISSLLS